MTNSQNLIPDGPDDVSAEQQRCYICGQSLPHYAMGHLHVSARFEHPRRAGSEARDLPAVPICPGCTEAGTRFALNPLARTLRQNPMGRAAA